MGYFEGGSHQICDVEICAVLVPELQQVLETLRSTMRAGALGAEGEIDAVAGDHGVSVAPPSGGFETVAVSRKVGGEIYRFNAESFFQINHHLLERMISEALHDARGELALDLFCGAGLFTVPLGRRLKRVVAVESDPTAARFANENLRQAGLANTSIVCSRVNEWLEHNKELAGSVDLLVLDPPRTGAEPSTLAGILALRPRKISYVSCDPATLARDLKQLLAGGYSLDSLKAFDMFPQTHHVETVARLVAIDD
jgi:23S rRNA (uracil1939-C5)-methyltransferase